MEEKFWFKFGGTSVANRHGLRENFLDSAARQLAVEHARGRLAGIVTSGAVLLGKSIDPTETDEQVLASMGSAGVVVGWQKALTRYGLLSGQVLATNKEMNDPEEGGMLHKALFKMNDEGVVPIFNENDLLSEEELIRRRFGGDNDKISGHLVRLTEAGGLFIVTKASVAVRGLMRADGKYLVPTVAEVADHSQGIYSFDEALGYAGYEEGKTDNDMSSKTKTLVDLAREGKRGFIGPDNVQFDTVIKGQAGTEFMPVIPSGVVE